ncbi:hypothetical protein MRX96_036573 [Rhipicephalus microplus]
MCASRPGNAFQTLKSRISSSYREKPKGLSPPGRHEKWQAISGTLLLTTVNNNTKRRRSGESAALSSHRAKARMTSGGRWRDGFRFKLGQVLARAARASIQRNATPGDQVVREVADARSARVTAQNGVECEVSGGTAQAVANRPPRELSPVL